MHNIARFRLRHRKKYTMGFASVTDEKRDNAVTTQHMLKLRLERWRQNQESSGERFWAWLDDAHLHLNENLLASTNILRRYLSVIIHIKVYHSRIIMTMFTKHKQPVLLCWTFIRSLKPCLAVQERADAQLLVKPAIQVGFLLPRAC
eukprot:6212897-Pleurochrysis_carterae.AAC.1